MMRVLPIALLALAGCAPKAAPVVAAPGVECMAEPVQALVGRARSDAVTVEAKRLSGAKVVRWLTPDMIVTMEFRADRLNLVLGMDGRIGSARCG